MQDRSKDYNQVCKETGKAHEWAKSPGPDVDTTKFACGLCETWIIRHNDIVKASDGLVIPKATDESFIPKGYRLKIVTGHDEYGRLNHDSSPYNTHVLVIEEGTNNVVGELTNITRIEVDINSLTGRSDILLHCSDAGLGINCDTTAVIGSVGGDLRWSKKSMGALC